MGPDTTKTKTSLHPKKPTCIKLNIDRVELYVWSKFMEALNGWSLGHSRNILNIPEGV